MHDLIIIGAGPAGLTAGLYAGRSRLHAALFEKMNIGGQIISSPSIDNFPGFPEGIATQELIGHIKKQVDDVQVPILLEEVLEITPALEPAVHHYKVKTQEKIYEARAVIIATGAYPKKIGVEGESGLLGRGVSYCGTCDAPLFKNKDVVAVGGGDRAIEEAIYLAGYAKKVTLVHRRQEFRASKILEEKARANHKINFMLDSVVEQINGHNKVDSVRVRNVKTAQVSELPCEGVFIFIGIKPNTDFVRNFLEMNEQGFIITQPDLKSSRPGIFACGDCLEKGLYQVVCACGEGAQAADSAYKYLLTHRV